MIEKIEKMANFLENISKSLTSGFQDLTEPITGSKRRKNELQGLELSLDNITDQLKFAQALGGLTFGKPFDEIEKTRELAVERLSESDTSSTLGSLIGRLGTSLLTGFFQGKARGTK